MVYMLFLKFKSCFGNFTSQIFQHVHQISENKNCMHLLINLELMELNRRKKRKTKKQNHHHHIQKFDLRKKKKKFVNIYFGDSLKRNFMYQVAQNRAGPACRACPTPSLIYFLFLFFCNLFNFKLSMFVFNSSFFFFFL